MLTVHFTDTLPDTATAVALKMGSDLGLEPIASQLDQASGGRLAAVLKVVSEPAKAGTVTAVPAVGEVSHVLLYGTDTDSETGAEAPATTAEGARLAALDLGGTLVSRANQLRITHLHIVVESGPTALSALEAAIAMAEGAQLAAYRFDKYHTTTPPSRKPTLTEVSVVVPGGAAAATAAFADREAVVKGVCLTRDLVSEPANVLGPEEFATRCQQLAALGVDVEVMGQTELEAHGFTALLAVNQGSAREPRVVIMRWSGAPDDRDPLVLIGKGVCFDTGGISIKPAQGMEDMKWDMGGAGVVTGTMAALAGRKARANVIGIIGLVENMPSGTAQRPGDVIGSMGGKTIEVINTDAEGRLVLADLLTYSQKHFSPAQMIDLATLTGAMIIALGDEHAGIFANTDAPAEALLAAGKATGEKVWRLPLAKAYDRLIDSPIADMKNTGGRPAGSITAAQFLQRFVENGTPWMHIDIAGVTWASKDRPIVPKGGSGFGVRLLDHYVAANHEVDGEG